MASLEWRIQVREITERPVVLPRILNNPERSAQHAPLQVLLKRWMGRSLLL